MRLYITCGKFCFARRFPSRCLYLYVHTSNRFHILVQNEVLRSAPGVHPPCICLPGHSSSSAQWTSTSTYKHQLQHLACQPPPDQPIISPNNLKPTKRVGPREHWRSTVASLQSTYHIRLFDLPIATDEHRLPQQMRRGRGDGISAPSFNFNNGFRHCHQHCDGNSPDCVSHLTGDSIGTATSRRRRRTWRNLIAATHVPSMVCRTCTGATHWSEQGFVSIRSAWCFLFFRIANSVFVSYSLLQLSAVQSYSLRLQPVVPSHYRAQTHALDSPP